MEWPYSWKYGIWSSHIVAEQALKPLLLHAGYFSTRLKSRLANFEICTRPRRSIDTRWKALHRVALQNQFQLSLSEASDCSRRVRDGKCIELAAWLFMYKRGGCYRIYSTLLNRAIMWQKIRFLIRGCWTIATQPTTKLEKTTHKCRRRALTLSTGPFDDAAKLRPRKPAQLSIGLP
jgi:hypothetical protein